MCTNLHSDVADAVNIMLHRVENNSAAKGPAQWEIFKREDYTHLDEWIKKNVTGSKSHPIYDGYTYLSLEQLARLVKDGKWCLFRYGGTILNQYKVFNVNTMNMLM